MPCFLFPKWSSIRTSISGLDSCSPHQKKLNEVLLEEDIGAAMAATGKLVTVVCPPYKELGIARQTLHRHLGQVASFEKSEKKCWTLILINSTGLVLEPDYEKLFKRPCFPHQPISVQAQ